MISPEEFIQLGLEEIERRIESKDPFLDVSHVVRRKKPRRIETYIMKKCLVYLEMPKKTRQQKTMRDLFITYRELGLWIVVEEVESEVIKVISIRRYKYSVERNSWIEIENDADRIYKSRPERYKRTIK